MRRDAARVVQQVVEELEQINEGYTNCHSYPDPVQRTRRAVNQFYEYEALAERYGPIIPKAMLDLELRSVGWMLVHALAELEHLEAETQLLLSVQAEGGM